MYCSVNCNDNDHCRSHGFADSIGSRSPVSSKVLPKILIALLAAVSAFTIKLPGASAQERAPSFLISCYQHVVEGQSQNVCASYHDTCMALRSMEIQGLLREQAQSQAQSTQPAQDPQHGQPSPPFVALALPAACEIHRTTLCFTHHDDLSSAENLNCSVSTEACEQQRTAYTQAQPDIRIDGQCGLFEVCYKRGPALQETVCYDSFFTCNDARGAYRLSLMVGDQVPPTTECTAQSLSATHVDTRLASEVNPQSQSPLQPAPEPTVQTPTPPVVQSAPEQQIQPRVPPIPRTPQPPRPTVRPATRGRDRTQPPARSPRRPTPPRRATGRR